MKRVFEYIQNKKFLIFQLMVVFAFMLIAINFNKQTLEASSLPPQSSTISRNVSYDGFSLQLTYPSHIYEGQQLPLTVRLTAASSDFDYIDAIFPDYNNRPVSVPAIVSISSFHHSDYLFRNETASSPYLYPTNGLEAGSHTIRFAGFSYRKGMNTGSINSLNVSISFTVVGEDTTPPVIDGGGIFFADVDNPVTLNDIKSTLTAYDETDGDLTSSIVNIEDNYTSNSGTLGDYTTIWEVSDSAGNTSQAIVTIRVVDITDPVINLNGSSTMYLEVYSSYSEPGATVTDNVDSNIQPVITGSVNTSLLGSYIITYNATDSSGNTATPKTRTVIVRDTTAPEITLNGSSTIYVEFGTSYDELGAVVTDNYDTGLTTTISGSVNVGELGTYTITYNATDSSGNHATAVTRTVIVRKTTDPLIHAEDQFV
ncbi:MAG: DUF5011 domain-containing protein, partial [Acholeplasmataceae bacterium]|nr:DUF5011 domain-containing protein [Acholeplasmataceae bacterium]